jgi:excisionase family DNA binding protein
MTSNTASAKGSGVLVACSQGERLLTVEEVAEWLGVPVGTIYAWRYRSTGPASYKVGRHVRFRRVDVEHWLEDQRTEPVQPSMLRQLLGVSTVRKAARTLNSPRTGLRSTLDSRMSLLRRASTAPGAQGANTRPHPRILRGRGRVLGAVELSGRGEGRWW